MACGNDTGQILCAERKESDLREVPYRFLHAKADLRRSGRRKIRIQIRIRCGTECFLSLLEQE